MTLSAERLAEIKGPAIETRCGDCQSMSRCAWLIQRRPSDTGCDWSPSRFYAAPPMQETKTATAKE